MITINPTRLWNSLMTMAQLGATEKGGVCRLALTDLDRQARDLFIRWCTDAGCHIRIDSIGNIFARRAGSDPSRRAVGTGSHIDTQPSGGKFDGNYGVLAGLEIIRTLNDLQVVTPAPIEVCVWTNEEGSRFVPVMMGSGVFCGAFTLDHALSATDREGITVRQALEKIGYSKSSPASIQPTNEVNWTDDAQPYGAYFEAHIEQGPVLEDADVVIGAVTGALGQRWYDVVVTGQEAHAGPTPMALRRDALQAAMGVIAKVNAIALQEQPHGRGTVGYVNVFPNSRNVIPGKVTFTVDFRHADDDGLNRMDLALKASCASLEKENKVAVQIEQVVYFPPTAFDQQLVQSVRQAAATVGFVAQDIVSGAGHDAVYVARSAPSAMIFIPCKDGISHNEIEDAKPEHLAAGTNVLLHAMLHAAGAPQ